MEKRNLQRSMYELRDTSLASRIAMAVAVGAWVAISWWLLFGGGLEIVGRWAGRSWINGNVVRRICLAAAFSIYYIRVLFTVFDFFKRGVSWAEGLGVGFFILCNVPMLDAHLRDHYGAAFDDYARRTRKLIPLVY